MKRFIILNVCLYFVAWTSCQNIADDKKNLSDTQALSEWDSTDRTNDFYDDAQTISLKGPGIISIKGEVDKESQIDISLLTKHSVIIKETKLCAESDSFIGAYRYDGYALSDILNDVLVEKANEKDYSPIIDLFVEIGNAKGEKVVLSWGEIFYPVHRGEILIATDVMRIVPSKTKELWTLPVETRLIVSTDLVTVRNISSPNYIRIISWPENIPNEKGKSPLYSQTLKIQNGNDVLETLSANPPELKVIEYPAIFYGRGRGIHSTQPFRGVLMKEVLSKHFDFTTENIKSGLFVFVAADGYRAVYTFSEIMNRNDQSELLLIAHPELKDNAVFRLYPAMDFFSDRAVKAISHVKFSIWDK